MITARISKRQDLVQRIADRLLDHGVAQIALRDLAAELGTSDRMLLYYFEDKADLVSASLEAVSARLAARLERASPASPLPPAALLAALLPAVRAEAMAPVMSVWSDLCARGGRGEEPFRGIAQRLIAQWIGWIEARLAVADPGSRKSTAVALLAILEGARQLEQVLAGSTQDIEASLASVFVIGP